MRTISIAIQVGSLNRIDVGLLEFVAGLECLLKDRIGKQVAHLQAHQGLAAARGRCVYFCFQTAERIVFVLKECLTFDVDSIDQRGHEVPLKVRQTSAHLREGFRGLSVAKCNRERSLEKSIFARTRKQLLRKTGKAVRSAFERKVCGQCSAQAFSTTTSERSMRQVCGGSNDCRGSVENWLQVSGENPRTRALRSMSRTVMYRQFARESI